MKHLIAEFLSAALDGLPELAEHVGDLPLEATVERTRDPAHGDFASNLAMRLAKPARQKPRDIAAAIVEGIVDGIGDTPRLERVEIAGPGFINFHLADRAFHDEILTILDNGAEYGRQPHRASPRILLEFVSANPTGPLHVGHGRHAAFGATVGNLLEAVGYDVDREYYVNDAGRQMDILGVSVLLRMLEAGAGGSAFPSAGYRGDYIRDIAAATPIELAAPPDLGDLPPDAPDGDKEKHIDAVIAAAKRELGDDVFDAVRQHALDTILDDIRDDLEAFGVTFDRWFREQSLTKTGRIDDALAVLDERGMLYKKDGATWFRAGDFGDEKDRVVVRENGAKTYFASDIAYHFDKRERGYGHLVDIFGADHHGYVVRVKAGLEAMGYGADDLEVELVQFVALYRGDEKLAMSTRAGDFVTLRELREEVGDDAARFFYVMRSNDQHLDFDLELAKSRSNDNPVYYIQYAHARTHGIFRNLGEKSQDWDEQNGRSNLELLTEPGERALLKEISRYPEVLDTAARSRAPQQLVHYLRELAREFQSSYHQTRVVVDDAALRDARLALCVATRIVIANGLDILGVSAPESM